MDVDFHCMKHRIQCIETNQREKRLLNITLGIEFTFSGLTDDYNLKPCFVLHRKEPRRYLEKYDPCLWLFQR